LNAGRQTIQMRQEPSESCHDSGTGTANILNGWY
jgi:hypothetical protein